MENIVLSANIFSSFALFGLIWCVQLVHYPFFLRSDQTNFIEHIGFHKLRISFIVVPLMVTELLSSGWLTFYSSLYSSLHIFGFITVILIWIVTFLVQVPLHERLSGGYDEQIIKRLVKTNWIRTLLWSIKACLSLFILFSAIQ